MDSDGEAPVLKLSARIRLSFSEAAEIVRALDRQMDYLRICAKDDQGSLEREDGTATDVTVIPIQEFVDAKALRARIIKCFGKVFGKLVERNEAEEAF